MNVAMYLRKSRADIEAEKQGEMETLRRHKSTLLKVAKEQNLNLVEIKEEIVSGESISHRPKMLELLQEVENNKYDAVLVMDLDRLGRGDMRDQGEILETFKNSKTKIITPRKTYDLSDEFDEEYSEFEAFMARKELKLISRRMQRGRLKSVEEGNYICTYAPFGYDVKNIKKRERILVPNENADIVKTVFDLYIHDNMGSTKIADYLNSRGIKTTRGLKWYSSAVTNLLRNKVYCGYIQWKKKDHAKPKNSPKRRVVKKNPEDEWLEFKGKHKPIISENTYNAAQKILKTRTHVSYKTALRNPFAGIIKCKVCGKPMYYRPYTENDHDYLYCMERCGNKSSRFEFVEKAMLNSLKDALRKYQLKIKQTDLEQKNEIDVEKEINKKSMNELTKRLEELNLQRKRQYELYEQGKYDDDIFFERSTEVKEEIEKTKNTINEIKHKLKKTKKNTAQMIRDIKNTLELYPISSVEEKNILLKQVIKEAYYFKRKDQRLDDFELYVKLKLNEEQ